jgi:hypothetical protein
MNKLSFKYLIWKKLFKLFLKYRKKIHVKKIELFCYALRILLAGSESRFLYKS